MLSSFQKKVTAAAITCMSFLAILGFVVIILRLFGYVLSTFSTVLWPLVTAIILGLIMQPVVDFLSAKLRIGKGPACVITFVIFTAAIALLAALTLPKMVSQTVELVQTGINAAPELIQHGADFISEKFPETKGSIQARVAELQNVLTHELSLESAGDSLKKLLSAAKSLTGGIIALIAAVTAFAVTPIYLFYLLKGNYNFLQKLESNLPFLSPSMRDDIIFFVRKFTEILTSFFRGQLVIAVIMGLLYGTGLTIAGVKFGFLLGIFAGFLNIVPYLGTIIGLSTILPTAFFQTDGGLILAAVALAIFIAVQMLEGYVLTPKIMGDRTGLHPTVIIFAVFFWGVAFGGILGMIMAIPLTAFIVTVWMRIMEKLRAYDKAQKCCACLKTTISRPRTTPKTRRAAPRP